MKIKALTYIAGISVLTSVGMSSCVGDPNSPGLEYMPDMYRSSAVEGYWDYAEVDGKYSEEAYKLVASKYNFVPPSGTIPYQGEGTDGAMMPYEYGAPINADKTHGLFGIAQDTLGRDAAKGDVNPVPYSKDVEKEGKVLYERFCSHCHGEKGAGDGGVPATEKYPQPPAYDAGTTKDLTAGEIFYTITYGKGAMGSHASQLNKVERWKVVYYVQKLQGKELGVETPDSTMTGNPEMIEEMVEGEIQEMEVEAIDEEGHGEEGH